MSGVTFHFLKQGWNFLSDAIVVYRVPPGSKSRHTSSSTNDVTLEKNLSPVKSVTSEFPCYYVNDLLSPCERSE